MRFIADIRGLLTRSDSTPPPTPRPLTFDAVADELEYQHQAGLHSNASVAVMLNGELVLDLTHPTRNTQHPRPMYRAFSAGKPMAAAVLWRLLDAGRISLDAPVAQYWPEFAQSGKSGTKVRHVLTHTSGLAMDTTRSDVDWMDWGRVTDALASMEPYHEPGRLMQYHAFTFGWLVAEIAARVTGQPFATLFDTEVRQPLGLHDTYYAIPREDTATLDRVVPVKTGRDFDDPALPSKMDSLLLLEVSFPAGSCITTAADLARFYDAIVAKPSADNLEQYDGDAGDHDEHCDEAGGRDEHDGPAGEGAGAASAPNEVPWLSESTRELVYATHADVFDLDESRFARFGLGVAFADHQPNRMAAPPGAQSFGHGGLGTCVAWGDPEHNLSMAILTDTALPESVNYKRHNRVAAAARHELGLPAGELAQL